MKIENKFPEILEEIEKHQIQINKIIDSISEDLVEA